MLLNKCCCFSLKTGSIASGMFTLTTSMVQLFLQTAIWTGSNEITDISKNISDGAYLTWTLYIALSGLDVVLILVSLILIYGVEKELSPSHLLPWLIFLPIYVMCEAVFNINYIIVHTNPPPPSGWDSALRIYTTNGATITALLYWCLKLLINTIGFFGVISRYQQLKKEILKTNGIRGANQDSLDYPFRNKNSRPYQPVGTEHRDNSYQTGYGRFPGKVQRYPYLAHDATPARPFEYDPRPRRPVWYEPRPARHVRREENSEYSRPMTYVPNRPRLPPLPPARFLHSDTRF